MFLKNLAIGLLGFGIVSCGIARADTLQLVGTGGQAVGNVLVYPYNFSINGSTLSIPMMCLNFNREITQGETWSATAQSVSSTDNSGIDYREDAWIYSQLATNNYSDADIQFAVWDIFDSSDVSTNAGFDTVAKNLVSQAAQKAVDPTLIGNGFFNQFEVFVPTSDQTGWTSGVPQSFIVDKAAVTPEPSSLLLLGTGLFAITLLALRRGALEA